MSALKQLIINEIQSTGPMPIDRYMDLCLTHPEHGYYIKKDPLGSKGDFTTSPEISQIFGEILGIWCAHQWQQNGQPEKCAIVELGPGRGTLMHDLLRAIKNVPRFKPEIHLVEISPVLKTIQWQRLNSHNVIWHNEFPKLDIPTITIANEFFDALPIKQYIGNQERMITTNGNSLSFNMPAEQGTVTELCPLAQEIMTTISTNSIAGAIIDYGYRESSKSDTFQAMHNHQYISALENPGNADLTAHVDFAALINSSKKTASLCTQREFLLGHGADIRAKILNKEADLERLIAPEQMGELFKVLCF